MSSYESMKEAMRMDMEEVKAALDRTNITDEDRKTVIDTLKEVFYQWAQSNASACVMEDYIREHADYKEFMKHFIHHGEMEKKIAETYPEEFYND